MASVTVTRNKASAAEERADAPAQASAGKAGARPGRPAGRPATRPRRHWGVSPLTLRILAVNVLALALLVVGLLYLGRYQDRLVQAELDALETEARIFASALGEGAVQRAANEAETGRESYELSPELGRQMVRRLALATDTHTRLYGAEGQLLSDSRVLTGSPGKIEIRELPPPPAGDAVSRTVNDLYSRFIDVVPSREGLPLYRERSSGKDSEPPDVERALAGENSKTVWRLEARGEHADLLLTVAVPVQRYKEVLGAVLLSRSGAGIDDAIRSVRFDILKVFAAALLVTVGLSFYLASTIARPVRRLAQAADRLRTGHGRHTEIPDFTGRGDEIGELSGVLRDMTAALWARMDAIERFAADVAHEIKNPLTSLRSAVETVNRIQDPGRRDRLMAIIADDVQRLDRLISDISNASRLDAELSRAEPEPVDVGAMLDTLADIHRATAASAGSEGEDANPPRVVVEVPPGGGLTVPGLEGRLTQVFQNLIANALSFSPPGGLVRVAVRRTGNGSRGMVEVTVTDDGPGIPDGKEEAIFERFYTERPAGEKFGTHSGLGLSISKQIVEAHGGRITAANRRTPDGDVAGAVFTVRLPRP
ncbi:stimulus-sensing domain-containing protein [Azospirillum rugosum]|uniref:histidine kinase n=1 Tax=Azospirillum rugosum TaxID=416170 RepID=A0ABS4SUV8_9PROT|nr:stimulus-sensing domain-containing protein [Azospirillum rugosum]MBP2296341.1 two-component system sensor histidine kinase ChvG [Azospirillum rugosum]MDQ0529862.1 two-component system sensor histidine kinase ChvG [Azospirillum rugosum]